MDNQLPGGNNNSQNMPSQGVKMISPEEVMKVQPLDSPKPVKVISPEEVMNTPALDNLSTPKVVSPEEVMKIQPLDQKSAPKVISPEEVMQVQPLDQKSAPKVISPEEVMSAPALDNLSTPKVVSPEEVMKVQPLDQKTTPKVISPAEVSNSPSLDSLAASKVVSPEEVSSSPSLDGNIVTDNKMVSALEAITNNEPLENKTSAGPKTISADEVKKESINHQEKTKEEAKKEKKELKKSLKKKKKKEKADFVNFLLILAIAFLLIIIIAPPTLRKLMPEQQNKPIEIEDDSIILSCTGVNQQELYKINSRIKYVDGEILQNIITYTRIDTLDLEKEINNYSLTTVSALYQIDFFREIKRINISTNGNKTVVSIYDYVAENNTSNFEFMNHFQEREAQQAFYESVGYKCEILKD